jgi:hypothetical protein
MPLHEKHTVSQNRKLRPSCDYIFVISGYGFVIELAGYADSSGTDVDSCTRSWLTIVDRKTATRLRCVGELTARLESEPGSVRREVGAIYSSKIVRK